MNLINNIFDNLILNIIFFKQIIIILEIIYFIILVVIGLIIFICLISFCPLTLPYPEGESCLPLYPRPPLPYPLPQIWYAATPPTPTPNPFTPVPYPEGNFPLRGRGGWGEEEGWVAFLCLFNVFLYALAYIFIAQSNYQTRFPNPSFKNLFNITRKLVLFI